MNRAASPYPPPRPQSPGLSSLKGVIFASIVGSVLVLAAAVLFALLPGSLSEAADFRAARPCSQVSAPENGDCLAEWPATVVSTETGRSNKSVTNWVTLDGGAEETPAPGTDAGRRAGLGEARSPGTGSPCCPGAVRCGRWKRASCARTRPPHRAAMRPRDWPWGSSC
ncbi:hypothetical protein SBADM41S_01179 [Streptomyces badius]